MLVWKRIKNLWKISEYDIHLNQSKEYMITKSFPTIQKRLATIIPEEKQDVFKLQDE